MAIDFDAFRLDLEADRIFVQIPAAVQLTDHMTANGLHIQHRDGVALGKK